MIEPIYNLIPNYPGVYIALIEDANYNEANSLNDFCKNIDATLHVKNLSNKQYEKSLHVDEFQFEQNRYNNHAVQYDFVFVCAKEINNLLEIANKIYRILKNAGHLFFLCKKEFSLDDSEVFENSNFVAINTISLNDEYDIISAKKMHGWMKV
jgi:hypothetical protein